MKIPWKKIYTILRKQCNGINYSVSYIIVSTGLGDDHDTGEREIWIEPTHGATTSKQKKVIKACEAVIEKYPQLQTSLDGDGRFTVQKIESL